MNSVLYILIIVIIITIYNIYNYFEYKKLNFIKYHNNNKLYNKLLQWHSNIINNNNNSVITISNANTTNKNNITNNTISNNNINNNNNNININNNLKKRERSGWTFVAIPKSFKFSKETNINQRRAINSWLSFQHITNINIILACNDSGTLDVVNELKLKHIDYCPITKHKSIQFAPVMKQAEKMINDNDIMIFINADIVLGADFGQTLQWLIDYFNKRKKKNWFAFGQRYNSAELNKHSLAYYRNSSLFTAKEAELIKKRSKFEGNEAQDVFIWPKYSYNVSAIDDNLAIGRGGFDNYLVSHALQKQSIYVVDITPTSTILHPTHDYKHLSGANHWAQHPDRKTNIDLSVKYKVNLMCSETTGYNGLRIHKNKNGKRYLKSNIEGKRCVGPLRQEIK